MATLSTSSRPRSLPAIATIGPIVKQAGNLATLSGVWVDGPQFQDAQQLIASGLAADAVLLLPGDSSQALAWLCALRSHPRLARTHSIVPDSLLRHGERCIERRCCRKLGGARGERFQCGGAPGVSGVAGAGGGR